MARTKEQNKRIIKGFIKKVLIITLIIYIIFNFVFGFFVVYNNDMSPKVIASDLLLYYRLDKDYYVGDVIVLKANDEKYVLRIVAGPNDKVEITEDEQLIINGSYQSESNIFYKTGEYEDSKIKFPLQLKDNEYFVLGDLRQGAKDSRYFGPITKDDILGKVFSLFRRSDF